MKIRQETSPPPVLGVRNVVTGHWAFAGDLTHSGHARILRIRTFTKRSRRIIAKFSPTLKPFAATIPLSFLPWEANSRPWTAFSLKI